MIEAPSAHPQPARTSRNRHTAQRSLNRVLLYAAVVVGTFAGCKEKPKAPAAPRAPKAPTPKVELEAPPPPAGGVTVLHTM